MKKQNLLGIILLFTVSVFMLSAFSLDHSMGLKPGNAIASIDTIAKDVWVAPAAADSIKNPIAVSQENVSKGEEIYNMYCFSCHGDTGYGDGPAGGSMGVRPANFHSPSVIKQNDGALFWKLTNGKGNMPPFKEALTEEQRWQLIVFLRELGKS